VTIRYFKTVSMGTIGAGNIARETYTFEEAGTLRFIMVNERSGALLNKILVTLTLGADTFTREYVPASVLGTNVQNAYPIDRSVNKGDKLDITILNASTGDVNVDLVLAIE